MYRLVAYAPDGVRRFPVHRDELLIGSEPDCDICLPYTGVGNHHARLVHDGEGLYIEDLGSRRGVLVSGKRVRQADLEVLDEIRIGVVTLLVEDVVRETGEHPIAGPAEPQPVTINSESMVEHLARISEWVLADPESRTTLESLAVKLLKDFAGGMLILFQGPLEETGVKFIAATEAEWMRRAEEVFEQVRVRLEGEQPASLQLVGQLGEREAWICYHAYRALDRHYFLILAFPHFRPGEWSPMAALRTLGDLLILGLVHHVGHFEPILPGRDTRQNLSLDPALVVGESPLMHELVEQLKAAIDPPVHVLLRGESGTGKLLLARSLHLSGLRRHGPFVRASCAGTVPDQVEADLFGAEIAGKGAPVRRQGKIQLADGGTLYLADVDELSLDLQARLVRFLRSGEVEPAGSRQVHKVDVRLIASSSGPLELLVAKDQFRVDLAYLLSQMVLDAPPLRERKEDLPLLIQSHVNRFCHESGKRVQGITVKAMSALLSYNYPGNLPELENITRQLVNLSPSGQPIDVSLLPERVRASPIRSAARIDATTDLNLERLLADCEQAAILEALRRSGGNKSQAARDLGLSRNGLSMKIQRLGLRV